MLEKNKSAWTKKYINNNKILDKCFKIYTIIKGCEFMENENLIIKDDISNEEIKNLIYTIRGKQVMLDSDVAMLYHYQTKRINEAVKRNKERFPENFCFQLTTEEIKNIKMPNVVLNLKNENNWSQFATSSKNENVKHRRKKYLSYVFTEQGIAMLSGLLKNDIAVQVSINIMNAFVEMRKFLMLNGQIFERLTNIVFFEGQIYDAYSLIIDIIKKANKKILIIDNYIDDSVLKMLTKKNNNVEVVILTSDKSNIQQIDIQKFNKEYPILKVAKTNKFHDRFIIIDNEEMYHLGASIKDLGKKCFGINKIEDVEIMEKILNYK